MSASDLRVFACPKTHEKVVEIFGGMDRGSVLDLGAGEGALSLRLRDMGFNVRAADLFPEQFKVAQIPCDPVDLNGVFPYPDGNFDDLCGVEVIEHLENHFSFIRECHRVLKPGGNLVLTTPNILNMASRVRYLFTGFYPLVPRPINETARSPVWDHIHPITYYQLRYILHTNGFRIRTLTTDRYRKSAMWWMGLYPLSVLFTRTTMRKEGDSAQRTVNTRIRRDMRSPALLLGRTSIIVAEKL